MKPQSLPPPNPRYHQLLGMGLPWEGWGDTWLVVGIPVHSLLGCQAPQWHPSPRHSWQAGCGLQAAPCPTRKEWLVEHSTLPGCIETKRLPPSIKSVSGPLGHQGGEAGWNGVAGPALQQCTTQSGNASRDTVQSSPWALQIPCPSTWEGWLLDITILNVVEKDPVTPLIPRERVSLPEKKPVSQEEEITATQSSNRPDAVEPEGTGCSGELVIVRRWLPPAPPGLYQVMGGWVWPTPLEDVDSLISIPMGAQLDLSSLGSLQVVISHNPVIGEVQYQYQSRVISQTSLQLAPSQILRLVWPLPNILRDHEQIQCFLTSIWANKMLLANP